MRMRTAALYILALTFFGATAHATVYEACVNGGNGMMRLVDASTVCHANEVRIQWNQVGPQGPIGPQGPTGPQGPIGPQGVPGTSAGGPPYVYVCTPINFNNAGTTTDYLLVYNGSNTSANVSVNPLNKNGVNLAGATIPVSSGTIAPGDPLPVYPGQTGTSTVPLAAGNTMFMSWFTGQGNLNTDTNIAITMRVTSDQPIVATMNIVWSGFIVAPCTLLPK